MAEKVLSGSEKVKSATEKVVSTADKIASEPDQVTSQRLPSTPASLRIASGTKAAAAPPPKATRRAEAFATLPDVSASQPEFSVEFRSEPTA